MTKFPGKCFRCGAPISWEEGVTSVKCNFCGNINYSKTRISNVSKNQIIFPIKKFLIKKRIINQNQINYINDKSKKLFEKRFFRFSILIIFISTPLILIKANTINPKLKALCDEISKNEQTSFAASKTYRNCMKKIKGLNSRLRSQRINSIKEECKQIKNFEDLHLKLLNNPKVKKNIHREFETDLKYYFSEVNRLANRYNNYNYLRYLDNLAKERLSFIKKYNYVEEGIPYDFNTCKEELLNEFVYEGDKNNDIFINTYNNWWEDL